MIVSNSETNEGILETNQMSCKHFGNVNWFTLFFLLIINFSKQRF